MGGGGGSASLGDNPQAQAQGAAAGAGWTAPGATQVGYGGTVAPTPVFQPGAGVQTGIPQGGMGEIPGYDGELYIPGGFAAPGIAQYFAGAQPGGPGAGLSYDAGSHDPWLGEVAANAEETANTYVEMSTPEDDGAGTGGQPEVWQPGVVETLGGNELAYDSAAEETAANDIAEIIAEGGINPETGDPNIVAGPNVLSAADEGLFGFGNDYNEEFTENYNAAYDHSEANPTGMTTGNPLYNHGYVGLGVDPLGDAIGGLVNNSLVGTVGTAITGEPLMADVSSLLPPEESFSDYGNDNDSGGSDVNNDGDPSNDTGNAGWGFTSIADMFDGGGPGASGDSYTGGVHGSDTVGDTSSGSWWGGGSDNDDGGSDSGGGSDDGTWCCTAAFKHGMPIKKIKELRRWHAQRSRIWRLGYDTYGHYIANKLVKGSPFWSRVTEAGHTAFVERRVTPMSCLAVLVIAPGSYAVGLYKLLRRKINAYAL